MTLAQMKKECEKREGKCSKNKCPLACITDWYERKNTGAWCLMHLRIDYTRKYYDELNKGNKEKAEEILREYATIEQKYLKKEG